MAQREGEIENLAHAYRVLDVPWTASPRAIRTNYRKLVKRWHPDRHRPGTPSHTEATLMTGLLNEAYARIADAPLRAGHATPFSSGTRRSSDSNSAHADSKDEPDPSGSSRAEYVPRDLSEDAIHDYRTVEKAREAGAWDDAARPFDRIGFAVRFVLGALFGALLGFRVMINLSLANPNAIPIAVAAVILVCALASGFGGDAFWRAIRLGGIWWRGRWD
jgi:curved DNA-binding protein CbpA